MASMTNINTCMKDNYQQYASNDSGLSLNSNGGGDNCQKHINSQDFVCDDLTKSLFINSLCGNDLIQDDDIYSYKSKMEIDSIFQNKFRSFNLAKTDNFNFKNSCSFSSIIHDLENLKIADSFQPTIHNASMKINKDYRDNITKTNTLPNIKIVDEIKDNIKTEAVQKLRPKRTIKKNGIYEYLSSSINDYQGDKALNEIVSFIHGSSKSSKNGTSNKSKICKAPSIKIDECSSIIATSFFTVDSGVISDNSSPPSNGMINSITDTDSGTQSSPFVSLNNSDEDSSQILIEDFQEVLSKKQRKITCLKIDNPPLSYSTKIVCNLKSELLNQKSVNKTKKLAKTQTKNKEYNNLHSRASFQHFLSDRYISFVKKFNMNS